MKNKENFQKENPNVFLYNASLHTGEAGAIHIHADVIFFCDNCRRGMKRQTSLTKALNAMGFISDERHNGEGVRLNAITKWENKQREILRDLCAKRGINIIDGEHSKQHLSTEEFQIKCDKDFVDEQARVLMGKMDDFLKFVSDSNSAKAYVEHQENKRLRQVAAEYDAVKNKMDKLISAAWVEFNSAISAYFDHYREKKKSLYEEIHRARQGAKDSRKQLNSILNDIAHSNNLFINIFRLFFALFLAIETASMEREVKRLQETNDALKRQAKEIMKQSNDVSAALKTKELDDIERALAEYEAALLNAQVVINKPTRHMAFTTVMEQSR